MRGEGRARVCASSKPLGDKLDVTLSEMLLAMKMGRRGSRGVFKAFGVNEGKKWPALGTKQAELLPHNELVLYLFLWIQK